MGRAQEFDKAADNTGLDDTLDRRVALLGQQLTELGGGGNLVVDLVGEDALDHDREILVQLRKIELANIPVWHLVTRSCKTYRALSVGALIIAVRRSTERGTGAALATVANASPLGQVLLTLLLADLDLLLLATAAELIGLERVLRLESGAAVLGDITVRHDVRV